MDSQAVSGSKRPRIIAIGAIIGVLVGLYLIQIFALQIIEKAQFQSRATLFSQRAFPVPAPRGEIFDRNQDTPLASSHPAYTVNLVPGEVPAGEVPRLLARVALALHVAPETLDKLVPPAMYSQFTPVTLNSGVDYPTLQALAERSSEFPGVHWDEVSVRDYRDVGSLASVLGYVGGITQEELQVLYNSGYDAKSVVGKIGLEKQYDILLRGKDGTRYQTVDALGRQQAATRQEVPPSPGKSLVLTIDRDYQLLAEKALGERIGSVVILKPSTGEVLAMVSYPSYDSNAFLGPDASQTFATLLADTRYPFLNRAIQSTYPPGSTFKIIMTAAILGDGVLDPQRKIFSGPEYTLGDRTFKEHDPHGLGWVNLQRAVELSSDIYFYTAGVEYLGIERIARYAKDFGLSKPTGIDLPGEVEGQMPDADWKMAHLHSPWVGGDTVNTSIGQGYVQVSPLQMADAVANVVNEGKVYRPHLLKKVIDPATGSVEEPVPDLLFQSNVPAKAYKPLQDAMRGVIVNGTAAPVVTTTAVQIAGKTGTAEDGEKGSSNHSWFVAYAPFDDPDPDHKIVVVVQVERTNKWEWWAPKAANLIFQGIFAHQTYEQALKAIRAVTPWWG
jgi:penicillin-binding protein 2